MDIAEHDTREQKVLIVGIRTSSQVKDSGYQTATAPQARKLSSRVQARWKAFLLYSQELQPI